MVNVNAISKSFGKKAVLKEIDLHIKPGKITAILGHNGSGKTTLIKTVLGLVIPDSGDITVNGNAVNQSSEYRREIGYISQIARFPDNLTVRELIDMIKDLRGQSLNENWLIEMFNLHSYMNESLRNLSGGTKQKVNVLLSMMHNPKLLICDEPTVGLDPISLVKMKEAFLNGIENGQTIVLITHIISLVEEIADDVIYIQDGKVYFDGSVEALKSSQNESNLERAIAKLMEGSGYA